MALGSVDLAIEQAEAGLAALARVDVAELTDREVLELNQAAQRLRTRADAVEGGRRVGHPRRSGQLRRSSARGHLSNGRARSV